MEKKSYIKKDHFHKMALLLYSEGTNNRIY